MNRTPAIFVAHGAPFLAIDAKKGADYQKWGAQLGKPDAILVISAHWESKGPIKLGATSTLPLIYDFYGFPPELYKLEYPAPGAPELAVELKSILNNYEIVDEPQRGWDHGVWVPLMQLFPRHDIPLLQMSLPRDVPPRALFELGRALKPLRDKNTLIMGTGNITHNLRRVDFDDELEPEDWSREFDSWLKDTLVNHAVDDLLGYRTRAPHAKMNHPTDEHLTPMFIVLGAASSDDDVTFPIEGFEFQNISRRCVQFG